MKFHIEYYYQIITHLVITRDMWVKDSYFRTTTLVSCDTNLVYTEEMF